MSAAYSNLTINLKRLTVKQLKSMLRNTAAVVPRHIWWNKQQLILFIVEKYSTSQLIRSNVHRTINLLPPLPVPEHYMQLPTAEEVRNRYQEFYTATSNAALEHALCAVCSRELLVSCINFSNTPIAVIPNKHRLRPSRTNIPASTTEGMLLDRRGLNGDIASICKNCLQDLQKSKPDLPPKLSLANNMWCGPVPEVLTSLTIAEQTLIAQVFPRVFVYKLFPCTSNSDPSTLQRGMRGTCCSYPMNTDAVVSMIDGNILPQPASILPSILTVTFVGTGDFPKRWLKRTFRIRRLRIHEALKWLKENNPRYYGHINISVDRINSLPEDDVPIEILGLLQQNDNPNILNSEHDAYAPDASLLTGEDKELELENTVDVEGNPIFPILTSGMADSDLNTLTTQKLLDWALLNDKGHFHEGWYGVRHGKQPVADLGPRRKVTSSDEEFGYWYKAFPTLFPWGQGAPETERPVQVKLREHIQYLLEQADYRFRRHESFIFVAFSIIQKRSALDSAKVQMCKTSFDNDAYTFSTITTDRLKKAAEEENQNKPISDMAVRSLKKHVRSVSSRVIGSDASRHAWRSQIWSTTLSLGPPSLWLTINPNDLHDPVVQIFAGNKINMDKFDHLSGPNAGQRALTVAEDPFATAKFFFFTINTVLRTLFGIESTGFTVNHRMGVLGNLAGYFGAVETQGRGTLHLHMLLWMHLTPSADEIREQLETEAFRQIIVDYINANIHAYTPGLESLESIRRIESCKGVAYSRPPEPCSPSFEQEIQQFETKVARTEQLHTCHKRRCLIPDQYGNVVCKRRAPWNIAPTASVTNKGEWNPQRLYEYFNAWCPHITTNLRCNNDLKLLTNGQDTASTVFYITNYSSKAQQGSHNVSAIFAKNYERREDYPEDKEKYITTLREQQRLNLFRLAHALNQEQEIAAPLVIAYLMRWGDCFKSHDYSSIYWSTFTKMLMREYPALKQTVSKQTLHDNASEGANVEHEHENNVNVTDNNLNVTLHISKEGITARNQYVDYAFRSTTLECFNVLSYFTETYEENIKGQPAVPNDDRGTTRGRPRNERFTYLDEHPLSGQKQRVRRTTGHNTLPNLIGHNFPNRDDSDDCEMYAAFMLLLLKPWRSLQDLKSVNKSWHETFEIFMVSASSEIKRVIAGIQYFHTCATAASNDGSTIDISSKQSFSMDNRPGGEDEDEGEDLGGVESDEDDWYTDDKIEALAYNQVSQAERIHGLLAVESARNVSLLPKFDVGWTTNEDKAGVYTAEGGFQQQLARWNKQLTQSAQIQNTEMAPSENDGSVELNAMSERQSMQEDPLVHHQVEEALQPASVCDLNEKQREAYDIVLWHLEQSYVSDNLKPLRLFIEGEGGTGKSKVIQTITETFVKRGIEHELVKAAYTGVAASLVSGKTTHSVAGISGADSTQPRSQETRRRLEKFWSLKKYLIIDECSMLSKSFLAKLSRNISSAKGCSEQSDVFFGNLNIIICGDFHQFPPVATSSLEPLYVSSNSTFAKANRDQEIGQAIYQSFRAVVQLTEQMRVIDQDWTNFLRRLRAGKVDTESDIDMLNSLVITKTDELKYQNVPWNDAALITPRHGVRNEWNAAALRRHCVQNQKQLFIVKAEDTYKKRKLTNRERYVLESRFSAKGTARRRRKRELPREIEIAIGMKVMVTTNVEVDLDIANGARGEVVGIVTHHDEPAYDPKAPIVRLEYMPACVLVKLRHTRSQNLEGLDENVVPLEPALITYQIKMKDIKENRMITKTIHRRQFPITAAYAFTDYRAQGQTLPYVIVDLAPPPSGGLSLFNIYVALSRSRGKENIRILRKFDEAILKQSHCFDLEAEDERIKELDHQTFRLYCAERERRKKRCIV